MLTRAFSIIAALSLFLQGACGGPHEYSAVAPLAVSDATAALSRADARARQLGYTTYRGDQGGQRLLDLGFKFKVGVGALLVAEKEHKCGVIHITGCRRSEVVIVTLPSEATSVDVSAWVVERTNLLEGYHTKSVSKELRADADTLQAAAVAVAVQSGR
jgi:hypothetical protein